MSSPPVRVIKLGGSLLDWPAMPTAFARWLAAQPPAVDVMVVGGGAVVEAIRSWDRTFTLDPVAMHWLCVRAMSLTAEFAGSLLADARIAHTIRDLRLRVEGGVQILDVEAFLRADQQRHDPLPCDWSVTSDSIAARVAQALEAHELALLKSALPSAAQSRAALAECGYVDRFFPMAPHRLHIRCVNLRDPLFAQIGLDAGCDRTTA